MQWFGKSWGAPICETDMHIETPIGEKCAYCDELISAKDAGVVLPYASPPPMFFFYHTNCWLVQIVGSLAHQLHTCSCHGGDDTIPSHLTVRESADLAVDMFYKHRA